MLTTTVTTAWNYATLYTAGISQEEFGQFDFPNIDSDDSEPELNNNSPDDHDQVNKPYCSPGQPVLLPDSHTRDGQEEAKGHRSLAPGRAGGTKGSSLRRDHPQG